MSFLQLRGVEKFFGEHRAIKGVNLDVEKNEFIVFVGPSGCGKSTLLRMIAGLESIDGGSLHVDGKDITHLPSSQRELAMVFQSYALYPHMTVFDNMSFALKLAKVPVDEIKQKVERAAETLNLTPYLKRTPKELSGGQRQRVAIGRAIVRAPKIFLFDEPLSNLDAALRGQTRVEIHKLHRALGVTTIYVTHDQVEAMTLADRVVVLRDGAIEQVGAPLELYDKPANQFVAQFIGMPSMNIVKAAQLSQFGTLAGQAAGRVPADGLIGVRPEGVRVLPVGHAGVPGKVELIEALGADTLIHVDVMGTSMISRQAERTHLRIGDPVALEFDLDTLHCFDHAGRTVSLA
ncbi:multiple sugar transport system ATP-binding protein [Rhodoferax ferrireducens]|uniref:Multiple sugar transport system ATP-binding protein n=1 Tax=Rhodoferax ferrireducens TaxID=192843 RepID=A0ABU2CFB4_9BURK|nr:sn-glycerol-3-phosphate ABC transporter ATP-binding protein UgpC [Rhodoferax ferrireducens]MDR7380024.1 multiple sugar transport system ATP-binding protein [Rhodoferax ferrireducens]